MALKIIIALAVHERKAACECQFLTNYKRTNIYLFHFLAAKSDEKLNDVPEHDKGEADKETKGAAEVWDEGVKGIDEVLSEDGGGQRPVS